MVNDSKKRLFLLAGSSCISLLLIVLAYASSGPSIFSTKKVDAESTRELLLQYASKDADGDGLPDWQEALYGTDPNNARSVNQGVTDSEAVAQGLVQARFSTATSTTIDATSLPGVSAGPSTVTDQFGKELFGEYLKIRVRTGSDPSSSEVSSFVDAHIARLQSTHQTPDAFNQGQVRVSGTGPDALLTYASEAEKIVLGIDSGKSRSEIEYFSNAVYKNDSASLVSVKKYSEAYAVAGRALMRITVPKELASSHLRLANTLMHISESLSDMATLQEDPVRAMLGLGTYKTSASVMLDTLNQMGQVYDTEGTFPPAGTSGNTLYQFMSVRSKQ